MKKTKLIWGIILEVIGVVGICNTAGESGAYVIVCAAFIAVGLGLIVSYTRAVKKYKAEDQETQSFEEQQKQNARQHLENEKARLDAEAEKLRAENERLRAESNVTVTCPHCGAQVKGHHCDYCDSDF